MAHGTCSFDGCTNEGKIVRGLCRLHYTRWQRHGDPSVSKCPRQGNECSVEGCSTRPYGRGLCAMHYARLIRNGDPLTRRRHANGEIAGILRAAAAGDTDACIFIPGWQRRPYASVGGRQVTAARAVWIIANGDPGDLHVLHTCNGGSGEHGCINIRHLYLGTPSDNAYDKMAAGRARGGTALGEAHGMHKLTDDIVREARALYADGGWTYTALAERYGVHKATMRSVITRETWKHVA